MNKTRILIIGGLTGSGKTKVLENIIKSHGNTKNLNSNKFEITENQWDAMDLNVLEQKTKHYYTKQFFPNKLDKTELRTLHKNFPKIGGIHNYFLPKYHLNHLYNPDLNIINADLLQMFHNYKVLSNREILRSDNPMFKLYAELDLLEDTMTSYEYGQKVLDALEPGKLNIIEGGCAFYLYFLKTKVLADYENINTVFLEYDTSVIGSFLTKRVETMFMEGAFDEYFRVRNILST